MVEIWREDSMSFKLTNTEEFDSLNCFKNIMDKLQKESSKKGFKNMFDKNEKMFINEFCKKVLNNENSD